MAGIPHLNYRSQVVQLEELQPEQELPPPMGVAAPPLLLEKEAKVDIARFAGLSHSGQGASSVA